MLGHKNPNINLEKYSKYIKSNRTKNNLYGYRKLCFCTKLTQVVLLDIGYIEIHK